MDKQKQKELLRFQQLDHQPQKWRLSHTVLLVTVISGVIGVVILTEALINGFL